MNPAHLWNIGDDEDIENPYDVEEEDVEETEDLENEGFLIVDEDGVSDDVEGYIEDGGI